MGRAERSGRYAPAHGVLFLLACLQAAAAVPWWTAQRLGWLPDGTPTDHAHAMLLGYAAAVIGGFLFTRLSRLELGLAVAAWLAGRAGLQGPAGAAASLAYPALLMVLAGLPFLRSARSGHNLVFFPVLAGLLAAEAVFQAGALGWLADGQGRGVRLAFDLVVLLLLVMGGRIVPAAMAGVMRARGEGLADRNRPGLEKLGMAGMAVAALGHLALMPDVAALGWLAAGTGGLVRLAHWRPDAALTQPSLWPLHLGYLWLCAGLILSAAAEWTGLWPVAAAMHIVTIGGLGTITAVMMVRTVMLRERISAVFPRPALAAVALISLSAVARVGDMLVVSAALWSLAFTLLAVVLVRLKGRPA